MIAISQSPDPNSKHRKENTMWVNLLLILLGVLGIVLLPFIFLYIMTFIVVWKENRQMERDFEEVYKKWGIS